MRWRFLALGSFNHFLIPALLTAVCIVLSGTLRLVTQFRPQFHKDTSNDT